jgi:hypothetical protein
MDLLENLDTSKITILTWNVAALKHVTKPNLRTAILYIADIVKEYHLPTKIIGDNANFTWEPLTRDELVKCVDEVVDHKYGKNTLLHILHKHVNVWIEKGTTDLVNFVGIWAVN